MVLRVAAALAFFALGCLPRAAVPRLPERARVAAAFVIEQPGGVAPMPEVLRAKVAAVLLERNLEVRELPFDAYGPAFSAVRDTRRRFLAASELDRDAPYALLVEARPSFFSQLGGRYRWTVDVRLTAARRGAGEPVEAAFELPVFVEFEHERDVEVVTAAGPELAERAGSLFDSFLGAASGPSAGLGSDAIYFVLVDRFANADRGNDAEVDPADPAAFHGGDLAGLLGRLDHLRALGVGTVWLSPVFHMRTEKFFGHGAFHGYWTYDLNRVEPRFGDEAALRALSDGLHRRGMKLVLDLVVNHVGPDAPLVTQKPDWFHRKGALVDWNDEDQLTTHDVHGLPDLAQERDEVYRHLLQASLGWVERSGVDGFRLDAVKHVAPTFWARFNADLAARTPPGFLLLGEMLDGDPAKVAATARSGRFNAMFDFPLYYALTDVFCRDASVARLAAVLSLDRLYDDPRSLVTLVDNHDLPRVVTACAGDLEKVGQALTVQLTFRGRPSLQYGTEAALAGEKEPLNRADMVFSKEPLRPLVAQLLSLRARHEALGRGVPEVLEVHERRLTFAWVAASEVVVVTVNQEAESVAVKVPAALVEGSSARDLFTGQVVSPSALWAPGRSVRLVQLTRKRGYATASLEAQWRRGERRRAVQWRLRGEPKSSLGIVGGAPELGGWMLDRAVSFVAGAAAVELPVGAVVEYKLVARSPTPARWEAGGNRWLFVPEGDSPLQVELGWREPTG